MGTCYFCATPVDEDRLCFGCRESICAGCDNEGPIRRPHSPEEHSSYFGEDEDEEDDFNW